VIRHHPPGPAGRRSLRQRDERGASAVEFSLVLLPLVLVLYGLISFGMMFALKQSMTNAAADAARSAIGATDPAVTARNTVGDRLNWLGSKYAATDSPAPSIAACASAPGRDCITVTVRYPYKNKPLVPLAPGLGFIIPSTITSTATVQIS
jgi:Flp pilus assembly protein TadG